jgi:hypothetical protein
MSKILARTKKLVRFGKKQIYFAIQEWSRLATAGHTKYVSKSLRILQISKTKELQLQRIFAIVKLSTAQFLLSILHSEVLSVLLLSNNRHVKVICILWSFKVHCCVIFQTKAQANNYFIKTTVSHYYFIHPLFFISLPIKGSALEYFLLLTSS